MTETVDGHTLRIPRIITVKIDKPGMLEERKAIFIGFGNPCRLIGIRGHRFVNAERKNRGCNQNKGRTKCRAHYGSLVRAGATMRTEKTARSPTVIRPSRQM